MNDEENHKEETQFKQHVLDSPVNNKHIEAQDMDYVNTNTNRTSDNLAVPSEDNVFIQNREAMFKTDDGNKGLKNDHSDIFNSETETKEKKKIEIEIPVAKTEESFKFERKEKENYYNSGGDHDEEENSDEEKKQMLITEDSTRNRKKSIIYTYNL